MIRIDSDRTFHSNNVDCEVSENVLTKGVPVTSRWKPLLTHDCSVPKEISVELRELHAIVPGQKPPRRAPGAIIYIDRDNEHEELDYEKSPLSCFVSEFKRSSCCVGFCEQGNLCQWIIASS